VKGCQQGASRYDTAHNPAGLLLLLLLLFYDLCLVLQAPQLML